MPVIKFSLDQYTAKKAQQSRYKPYPRGLSQRAVYPHNGQKRPFHQLQSQTQWAFNPQNRPSPYQDQQRWANYPQNGQDRLFPYQGQPQQQQQRYFTEEKFKTASTLGSASPPLTMSTNLDFWLSWNFGSPTNCVQRAVHSVNGQQSHGYFTSNFKEASSLGSASPPLTLSRSPSPSGSSRSPSPPTNCDSQGQNGVQLSQELTSFLKDF
jgi:hypothetical protein